MLFILTGNIQTGKTRWLERLIASLEKRNVSCYGVVAPGVWRVHEEKFDELTGKIKRPYYEKLGIDNVLLPTKERIAFARRIDLAQADGQFDPQSQSASMQLKWNISDEAIRQVNAFFDTLRAKAFSSHTQSILPGLLVVDELGRLELEGERGLMSAVRTVHEGANNTWQHALIVVREGLADRAEERFSEWGTTQRIYPTDEGRSVVFGAYSRISHLFTN